MTPPACLSENRQEWFAMLTNYMKMKTLAVWLVYYPDTSYESFEAIWPVLFDRMLSQATTWAVAKLSEQIVMNLN